MDAPKKVKLSEERESLCKLLKIHTTGGVMRCYVHTSGFPDNPKRLAEVFLRCDSVGSTLRGTLDALGITMSVSLQHGVPLYELARHLLNMKFEPSGMTGNPDHPIAKSILDYLSRYLISRYPDGADAPPQSP